MTEQDSQDRSADEGKPKMAARKGQADRDRENRKSRTEQPGQDSQGTIAMKGIQNRTIGQGRTAKKGLP
jgi:hypothetical protein